VHTEHREERNERHEKINQLFGILDNDIIKKIAEKFDKGKIVENDVKFVLIRIQKFYETLHEYWSKNFEFHESNKYEMVVRVLDLMGKYFANEGINEAKNELYEKVENLFLKCMHILSHAFKAGDQNPYINLYYKGGKKYNFQNWMAALDELTQSNIIF
jgi:uncharacterized protein (DUF2164 family)